MKYVIAVLATLGLAVAASADTLVIHGLDSNGLLEGSPGQTVGFGFTFTSISDYAVLDFSDFAPTFSFGDYTDYIANDFIVTNPGVAYTEEFSQTYDPGTATLTETGIGQFTIDADATFGQNEKGILALYYDLYSVSPDAPNFDPSQDGVSFGNEITANVGVKVVAPAQPTSPTPEPATFALVGFGCVVFWKKIRSRTSANAFRRAVG